MCTLCAYTDFMFDLTFCVLPHSFYTLNLYFFTETKLNSVHTYAILCNFFLFHLPLTREAVDFMKFLSYLSVHFMEFYNVKLKFLLIGI